MKQTAVEWLYGKSKLRELDKFDLEQAKEMEKQNIEKEKAKSYMEGMKNQFIEKETAIDWLVEQMLKQGYFDINKPLTFTNLDHLQHQAKEIEKL